MWYTNSKYHIVFKHGPSGIILRPWGLPIVVCLLGKFWIIARFVIASQIPLNQISHISNATLLTAFLRTEETSTAIRDRVRTIQTVTYAGHTSHGIRIELIAFFNVTAVAATVLAFESCGRNWSDDEEVVWYGIIVAHLLVNELFQINHICSPLFFSVIFMSNLTNDRVSKRTTLHFLPTRSESRSPSL